MIHYITQKSNHLYHELHHAFHAQLDLLLKKMLWPKPDAGVPESLQDAFIAAVGNLLELQRPDLDAQEKSHDTAKPEPPLVLLPLHILIKPLELGFRYHFEGDRPTNRLDRPEFFLSHITDRILSKYVDFVDEFIQPILSQKFRDTDMGLDYVYIDAASAFITALLPMTRNKIFTVLPKILNKPALLSHFIHELTNFDTQLRDEWQYDGGLHGQIWPGLAHEVLSKDDTFARWLTAEKDFALARYHEIVDPPESFDLDFDSFGPGKTKPSKAAISVNDLLEATTDNYRHIVSFPFKLRFLIDIQISIFDLFHQRLSDGLAAYISRTSSITRISREDQTKLLGLDGLERLSRIFGSADYLAHAMRDWNDDVFFLELWSELQLRATQTSRNGIVAGSLTVAQIAARTSAAIGTEASDPASDDAALFDETAAAYDRIRAKSESAMLDLLKHNVSTALAPYVALDTWAALAHTPTGATTAELDGLLSTLRTLLTYLTRALGTVPARRLTRSTMDVVANTLMDSLLMRHSVSAAGATQLATDVHAIRALVAKIVDPGVTDAAMAKVVDAVRLLAIPVDPEEGDMGLQEAGRKMFEADGEVAKEVLAALGVETLTVGEARRLLARRVELGS